MRICISFRLVCFYFERWNTIVKLSNSERFGWKCVLAAVLKYINMFVSSNPISCDVGFVGGASDRFSKAQSFQVEISDLFILGPILGPSWSHLGAFKRS